MGTITPTDKKSRADEDIPFLKLSNGARNMIPRGWFREAVIELRTSSGKKYCVQCTTWRDKKQVVFLTSNRTGASTGLRVRRGSKQKSPGTPLLLCRHSKTMSHTSMPSIAMTGTARTILHRYARPGTIFAFSFGCWTV